MKYCRNRLVTCAWSTWCVVQALDRDNIPKAPCMKRVVITTLAAACLSASALAADVAVSVNIGQPGVYGRIDIGRFPQPQLVYAQPVMISPAPVTVVQQPIYLHVPVVQARNWGAYCGHYNACRQPVYFVQDGWYDAVYAPAYRVREHDDEEDDQGRDHYKHHGKQHDKGRGDDD